MSAPRPMSPASPNWLAMLAAIVLPPGLEEVPVDRRRWPTAPARRRSSRRAPGRGRASSALIDARPAVRQHRHAGSSPSGSRPGRGPPPCGRAGTWRKTSRVMAATIGRIMMASTTDAAKMDLPKIPSDVEDRDPAEVLLQPRAERDHPRHQVDQPPQPEDDAGHRGEQVDDVAEPWASPPRRVVA